MTKKSNKPIVHVVCSNDHTIKTSLYDWSRETHRYPKAECCMGEDICTIYELQDTSCPKCGEHVTASFEVWSYMGEVEDINSTANITPNDHDVFQRAAIESLDES